MRCRRFYILSLVCFVPTSDPIFCVAAFLSFFTLDDITCKIFQVEFVSYLPVVLTLLTVKFFAGIEFLIMVAKRCQIAQVFVGAFIVTADTHWA